MVAGRHQPGARYQVQHAAGPIVTKLAIARSKRGSTRGRHPPRPRRIPCRLGCLRAATVALHPVAVSRSRRPRTPLGRVWREQGITVEPRFDGRSPGIGPASAPSPCHAGLLRAGPAEPRHRIRPDRRRTRRAHRASIVKSTYAFGDDCVGDGRFGWRCPEGVPAWRHLPAVSDTPQIVSFPGGATENATSGGASQMPSNVITETTFDTQNEGGSVSQAVGA